jgi:hypothetical protein
VLHGLRSHLGYANVAATMALVLATTGFAVAAIPGSGGTITGCYHKKKGNLRVLDAGRKCLKGERKLAWSQTGPPGAVGAKGDTGAKGDPGGAWSAGSAGCAGCARRNERDRPVGLGRGHDGRHGEVGDRHVPPGEHATGGGVSVAKMPQTDFKVIGSVPLPDVDVPATGWRGTIYPETTDGDALIFAYAVCAAP